jgi:hypothetical protein
VAAWPRRPPPGSPAPNRTILQRLLLVVAGLLLPSLPVTALASATTSGPGELGVSWNARDVDGELGDMQRAGLTWVRTGFQFAWRGQATSYEWIDSVVERATAHRLDIILAMFGKPRNDLGSNPDREAYKQWLREMVRRYKSRVRVWEVGNEPNIHEYWNIRGNPGDASWNDGVRRYAQHLGDTYEAIKEEDPTATVLLGGLSQYHAVEFFDRLVDERVDGRPSYHFFDAMNLHPYGDTPDDVVAEVRAMQRRMAAVPGVAGKDLWITEFGWQTSWKRYHRYVASEEIKARYLVESIRKLRTIGIRTPILIYTWRDDGFTREDVGDGSGFGLTTKRPRTVYLPAFYELQRLIRQSQSRSPGPQEPGRLPSIGRLAVALGVVAVGLGVVLLGVGRMYVRRRRSSSSQDR